MPLICLTIQNSLRIGKIYALRIILFVYFVKNGITSLKALLRLFFCHRLHY